MTFTEIIEEARDQARVPTSTAKTTFIRRQINLAMDEFSRFRPWWFMETRLSLTLAAGSYIDLPSRFTCMDHRTMRTASDQVEYVDFSRVESSDPDLSESGTPEVFSFVGEQFAFWPKLSASFVSSGSLSCRHFQTMKLLATDGTATASLHGDSDSPDPPLDLHEGIILGTTYRLLKFDGIARWAAVKTDFVDFLRGVFSRNPTIGAPGPTKDGDFAYIVGL